MCPALNNEHIIFNAEGFNHICRKPNRPTKEIIDRLQLLWHAETILQDPFVLMTYRKRSEKLMLRKSGVRRPEEVEVQYWRFEKPIGTEIVKVLVRQVNDGQKHFFSIMLD